MQSRLTVGGLAGIAKVHREVGEVGQIRAIVAPQRLDGQNLFQQGGEMGTQDGAIEGWRKKK
jgi:hypothetical protein